MNLKNISKCTVLLLDNMAQVLVDGVRDSHVFIGPTESSVFLRNCERCVFTVACRQLRTRDLGDCTLNLFSCVDPGMYGR